MSNIEHHHNHHMRIKTLSVIAEGCVQKIGHIALPLGPVVGGDSILGSNTLADLENIIFTFQQVGQPIFSIKILEDKVINCGFIQFNITSVTIPANINPALAAILNVLFPAGTPIPIAIPLQGALDVEGVRSTDDIEEFFDVEGVTSCFIIETILVPGADESTPPSLVNTLVLEFKAAVNTRIIASRFTVATAELRNVEDISDFDDEE